MSPNSSNNTPRSKRSYWTTLLLLLWVVAGFALAQAIVIALLLSLKSFGVPLVLIDTAVLNALIAALVYVFTLVIVIGAPWWLRRIRTTRQDMGLSRLPTWMDILLAPAGFVIYFLLSSLLVYAITQIIPGFDVNQTQDVGFSHLAQRYEYVIAFATLVVIAPIAEEMLFRGYLYGKLRQRIPIWLAILLTSLLFGAIHGQWNVAVDVFGVSVVLCGLREVTGNIWAGVLVHMIKNGLAFYILFINPTLLHTIGG